MAFTLLYFRLFVKLSLAYVPKSKVDDPSVKNSRPPIPSNTKSAPLDLLLYDSLCWDCESSGKCNVFRIGKTISTKISNGKKMFLIYNQKSDISTMYLCIKKLHLHILF